MSGAAPRAAFSAPAPPLPDGWQFVTAVVLPNGSLGLLGTDVDCAGAWARVWRQQTEHLPPERPQAVAVDGPHLLLAGGYRADDDRLALLTPEGAGQGDAARLLATWRLSLERPMPAGDPPGSEQPSRAPPMLLAGRGDTLHLVADGIRHCWHVADLVAAVPEVSG